MPKKIIDENGDEIEVFTADELSVEKEKLTKVEADKIKLEEELKGLKDKDLNFSNLRNKVSEKEKEVEDLKKAIDEKIGTVKKEVLDSVMSDYYLDQLKKLAGEDKELADKIEFQYKRLSDPSSSKEEVNKKLNDAFVLASGGKEISNTAAFSSGGVGKINIKKSGEKLSEEAKQFGIELAKAGGITLKEEDFNK